MSKIQLTDGTVIYTGDNYKGSTNQTSKKYKSKKKKHIRTAQEKLTDYGSIGRSMMKQWAEYQK